jgi:hypothetical protein
MTTPAPCLSGAIVSRPPAERLQFGFAPQIGISIAPLLQSRHNDVTKGYGYGTIGPYFVA